MEQIKAANAIERLVKLDFRGERVLTTKQMAEVYETKEINIQNNFKRNLNRFEEKKHYYKLEGEALKEFKRILTESKSPISDEMKFTSSLVLWTEKGANRMCKILDTDKAWQQYDVLEETYFNVKYKEFKPLSTNEILELEFKLLKENQQEILEVKEDIKDIRENSPLFNIECDDLQKLLRKKGTSLLGGKGSNAYQNKSLRQRVYSDIQSEIKRQFNVVSYKAIKRKHLDIAKEIIKSYNLPFSLSNEIDEENQKVITFTFDEM